MQFFTVGKEFYPQINIPLRVYKNLQDIPECPKQSVFQIIIIESGNGIIRINGQRALIHAPVAYFINELESASLENAENINLHIVYFHPATIDNMFDYTYIREASNEDVTNPKVQDLYLLNEFISREGIFKNHCQLTQIMLRKLLYFINGIQDEFDNQRTCYWVCRGRSFLLEMLCYLTNLQTSDTPDMEITLNAECNIMDEVLIYIHTNYAEKITLGGLVDVFNINRTTLNEMFRKKLGETIISYIIKLRIEFSSLMLRDTGIPIQEIAFRVGFEDSVYFSQTFKRLKGCSPKKYREDYCWLQPLS